MNNLSSSGWFLLVVLSSVPCRVDAVNEFERYLSLKDQEYDQTPAHGPHHQRWPTVTLQTNQFGLVSVTTNDYVELGNGLNYWSDNQWKRSTNLIELEGSGAVAKQGAHQLKFTGHPGRVEITQLDGLKLHSQLVGLYYFDAASGLTAQISGLKESQGEIYPPNQVIWTNAFESVLADIRYVNQVGSFEQDIILKESLPSPEKYGFDPQTTFLEVITEFPMAPQASIKEHVLKREEDPAKRGRMAEPDWVDQDIRFSTLALGTSRVYLQGKTVGKPPPSARTMAAKKWWRQDHRTFLIEATPYPEIENRLRQLPASTRAILSVTGTERIPNLQLPDSLSPNTIKARTIDDYDDTGLVLDYRGIDQWNNFVFLSGETYYVTGCDLYTHTTFQNGTILKMAGNGQSLFLHDAVTGPTNGVKAFITARDDDSIGEVLPDSDHSITVGEEFSNASFGLNNAYVAPPDIGLHYLDIRYLHQGLHLTLCSGLALDHLSLYSCSSGLYLDRSTASLRDSEICSCVYPIDGGSIPLTNVTFDCGKVFRPEIYPYGSFFHDSQLITLLCHTTNAQIYYTTNNTAPTTSSILYNGPFTIYSSILLRVKGFKAGMGV